MHPIQQKAILAILASAESQIALAKSMMFMDVSDSGLTQHVTTSKTPDFDRSYIRPEEEDDIEKQMEAARLAEAAHEKDIMRRWEIQRQQIHDDEAIS